MWVGLAQKTSNLDEYVFIRAIAVMYLSNLKIRHLTWDLKILQRQLAPLFFCVPSQWFLPIHKE